MTLRVVSSHFALALGLAVAVFGNAILPSSAVAQSTGAGVGSPFELTFWQSVAASDDRGQLEAYLAQYPNGTFSALARAKIAAIDRQAALARGASVSPPAPAPAPVPVAPAAAPPPAAAAPPAATSAMPAFPASPVPAPVPAPLAGEQLRSLGQSQSQGPLAAAAAAAATQSAALPARPQLATPPDVVLPDHFCSAIERNNFYDGVYTPSKQVAEQNNRTANDHMSKLRQIYDDLAKTSNAPAMNVVAEEAKTYQAVATHAYEASAAYEQIFSRLMATPIRKCS